MGEAAGTNAVAGIYYPLMWGIIIAKVGYVMRLRTPQGETTISKVEIPVKTRIEVDMVRVRIFGRRADGREGNNVSFKRSGIENRGHDRHGSTNFPVKIESRCHGSERAYNLGYRKGMKKNNCHRRKVPVAVMELAMVILVGASTGTASSLEAGLICRTVSGHRENNAMSKKKKSFRNWASAPDLDRGG